ncbi:MAG: hypothetical protein ACI8YQ_003644 [Polaribacter sp.]|jgi:hypothetical protein
MKLYHLKDAQLVVRQRYQEEERNTGDRALVDGAGKSRSDKVDGTMAAKVFKAKSSLVHCKLSSIRFECFF